MLIGSVGHIGSAAMAAVLVVVLATAAHGENAGLEIRRIPDPLRRRRVEVLSGAAGRQIKVDDTITKRAEEVEQLGIRKRGQA